MSSQGGGAPRPRRRIWTALLLLVAVAALAILAWIRHPARVEQNLPAQPTLVVLPLHPAGARHEEGVLAEGLSVELAAQLSHIDGLRTIARTTALRAGTDHLDGEQLARRVGATLVLTGELHELGGDQLHLDLQLLDAPGGRRLWSQTFEHKLADIAALEREIVVAVAHRLQLPAPAAKGVAPRPVVDPQVFRDYMEARQLVDSPQRDRGIDMLRDLVRNAPNFAPAHAALARTLASAPRAGTSADLADATLEARTALEQQENIADAHVAQAILDCRAGAWPRCMQSFAHVFDLEPADADARLAYAYWLSALGYVDAALAEAERAWLLDPLSYNANFARARLLDTVGRHDEAAHYLAELSAESGGLIYAKWHNAVWRHDYADATALVAAMPRNDGFREAYTVVTEALSEPRLWPQALPLIATSERANGGINVQRIMMPNPDYGVVIAGLEKMLRDGWPSYYMLLWMPEYTALRRDPAFQDFLKRTRVLDYWREHGFPPQCRADGAGARCN